MSLAIGDENAKAFGLALREETVNSSLQGRQGVRVHQDLSSRLRYTRVSLLCL